MENNYLDCQLGLTPQCPQINNPIMQKFFAGSPTDYFTTEDMQEADNLCATCSSFTPRQ